MKTALITGAAGGLGRALVEAFLRAGWMVGAGWHKQACDWPAEAVLPVRMDVDETADCESGVTRLVERWGSLDCLVNNAGLAMDQSLARATEAEFDRVMGVNLRGTMRCTRAALKPMITQRAGHVINISSFAARNGSVGQSAYAAAKAALIGLTQSLAREVGSRNVRVNAVMPGLLQTSMTANLPAQTMNRLVASNVLARPNSVEEVSRFVAFLAEMKDVSGQVFQLDSRLAPWT